jgi:hypothetical protein
MTRTQQTKVPIVETGELGLVETLDHRQDCRVDKANIGIGVAITYLTYPPVVGWKEVLDDIRSVLDVAKEGDQYAGLEPLVDPVVKLHQHRGRNHEWFTRGLD